MNNLRFEQINENSYHQLFSISDLNDLSNFMSHTKPTSHEILEWFSVFKENDLIGSYWLESRMSKLFIGVFVLSRFRGKNHGKSILQQIISVAKKNDIKEIYLNVRENNINAIQLYEKFGFLKTKNFINSSGINSIEFKLKL